MRIIFKLKDTLQVFRLGVTSNEKISSSKAVDIVQSYTFSRKQFELDAKGMKEFFSVADTNCLDCPFNEFGKCYTHKFNQYVGFKSMLKSIKKEYPTWDDLPTEIPTDRLVDMARDKYVRFGTYGEPSLHPFDVVSMMVSVAKSHTGYTHQWDKDDKWNQLFMASTHNLFDVNKARSQGWRSFAATDEPIEGLVNCPASTESGKKTSCDSCNLCAGASKKAKDIYILKH